MDLEWGESNYPPVAFVKYLTIPPRIVYVDFRPLGRGFKRTSTLVASGFPEGDPGITPFHFFPPQRISCGGG